MLKNLRLLTTTAVAIGFAMADTAEADPPVAPLGTNQNMVTEFKGALKNFQRGVLLVTREDGTEIMVQPPDNISSFQFVATAKPAFLQRGMLVRFKGTFNQAGVPLSPVTRVELFQPVSGQVTGHARDSYTPGVHGDRRAGNQIPQAVAQYDVVGALMGLDPSGIMMVQAGKYPVRVQLTPNATFEIRFNNLSLAKEGDPVTISGFYQPPDETKVKADHVTITTDRVYGEPSEEPVKRVSRRRSRRTQDKTEDKTDEKAGGEGDAKPSGDEANSKPEAVQGAKEEKKATASDDDSSKAESDTKSVDGDDE